MASKGLREASEGERERGGVVQGRTRGNDAGESGWVTTRVAAEALGEGHLIASP